MQIHSAPLPTDAGTTPRPDPYAPLARVLDAGALGQLQALDPEGAAGLLPRVLRAFDTSLQRLSAQVSQARGEGDLTAIRHVAHTLKSSSASVGALELSRLCAQIEADLREGRTQGLDPLLDDMLAQCEWLRAALKPVLENLP